MGEGIVRVGSMACAALLIAACGDRAHEARSQPSEAAKVIGVPPAPPGGDTPYTAPVHPKVNEVAKPVEVGAMPLPGQADDPETIAALNSERSEAIDVLKDPELAKIANSDTALEAWRLRKLGEAQRAELQRRKTAAAR